MTDRDRRLFLQTSLTALAAASTAHGAEPEKIQMDPTVKPADEHQVRPLPFDPKSLRGLSERLISSHWENNYGGAVKALNAVRRKLQTLLASEGPAYMYNDFKREHLIRTGSVVLMGAA